MNEANEVLTRRLEQLERVLNSYPELSHIYLRRPDEVLVDVTRDQAKATLVRHPDWTIEKDQPGSRKPQLGAVEEETQVPEQEPVDEVEVPAKPSEESVAEQLEEPQAEANKKAKKPATKKKK